jgi:ubiquinone/menaquinone biosynthesis C-methylase UbiE
VNAPLTRNGAALRCDACSSQYPITPSGIIDFLCRKSEQSAYFDERYGRDGETYENSASVAERYLSLCGCDLSKGVENASILDVACGSGRVTAGLIVHPNVRNCKIHAFDVSISGLELLRRFEQQAAKGTNRVETSVQSAQEMFFADASFDYVIGNSVLHHFSDPGAFLRDCRRVLKPGGVATFGEPFAIGYALGAAALMLAQSRQRRKHDAVERLYNDLSVRIKAPPEQLATLVDKHLFLHSTFLDMASAAGFKHVDFVPAAPREFYRERFIKALLQEHGVEDPGLCKEATRIYRVMFDLFDTETYGHSVAAFLQLVLRA